MGQYRKKPIVVEARQIDTEDYDGMCEILSWCGGIAVGEDDGDGKAVIAIQTLEGRMVAGHGDWIVKEIKGDFHLVKEDIFALTCETADIDWIRITPAMGMDLLVLASLVDDPTDGERATINYLAREVLTRQMKEDNAADDEKDNDNV